MTIFGSALGSFLHPPTPPGQCCDPKWTHFHAFYSKFKEREGWGEDASFTNIAPLLTSKHQLERLTIDRLHHSKWPPKYVTFTLTHSHIECVSPSQPFFRCHTTLPFWGSVSWHPKSWLLLFAFSPSLFFRFSFFSLAGYMVGFNLVDYMRGKVSW